MKKQLILIGIIILLVSVELSGCNEESNNSITLSDGTKVIGDTGQIQIIEHNLSKRTMLRWDLRYQQWKIPDSGGVAIKEYDYDESYQGGVGVWNNHVEVPWDLNISDLDNDVNKRKEIYLEYINSDEWKWELIDDRIPHEPFTVYLDEGFYSSVEKASYSRIYVVSNLRKDTSPTWYVTGTVKNIGNSYLGAPIIIINFYNSNGAWLDSKNYYHNSVPSGYNWSFYVKYDGQFRNDVNYISFEVTANS